MKIKLKLTEYDLLLIKTALAEFTTKKRKYELNKNMEFNIKQAEKLLNNLAFYEEQLKEEENEE